jgi:hypothetical protein
MKRLIAAVLVLGGCAGPTATLDGGAEYPSGMARGPTLDLQVFRRETTLEMTNSTARPIGACTMWLNGRFSRAIEGLAVGQTLELPLSGFRDQFGEAFRGGGFFATEKPDRVVLAELQLPDRLVGLVVVGDLEGR